MLFFLFFSFICIILNILIIGILFSKVVINVEKIDIYGSYKLNNLTINDIKISIDLYLYKFIKILSIKFYKDYFKIGFIKIYYNNILKYEKEIIKNMIKLSRLLLGKNRLTLSILEPEIEIFNMNLIICSKNAALTSIISGLIGGTTSAFLSKYVKKFNKEKIFYNIIPAFLNINRFKIEAKIMINFNTLNILAFLYNYYLVKNNTQFIG